METRMITDTVSVELPLHFAQSLMALIHRRDDSVSTSLRTALETNQGFPSPPEVEASPLAAHSKRGSPALQGTDLTAEILGQRVKGATLPGLFARCVDLIHDLDPSVIERFAGKKTHARRYVARRSQDIHIRSPHLKTLETKSGWWISANVSEQQVTTAMHLLAEVASLTFGEDIIFPLPAPRCP